MLEDPNKENYPSEQLPTFQPNSQPTQASSERELLQQINLAAQQQQI
jgi:hypothetical protein